MRENPGKMWIIITPNTNSFYAVLYGWVISLVLYTHGFKWISKFEEFTTRKTAKLVKKNKHS